MSNSNVKLTEAKSLLQEMVAKAQDLKSAAGGSGTDAGAGTVRTLGEKSGSARMDYAEQDQPGGTQTPEETSPTAIESNPGKPNPTSSKPIKPHDRKIEFNSIFCP